MMTKSSTMSPLQRWRNAHAYLLASIATQPSALSVTSTCGDSEQPQQSDGITSTVASCGISFNFSINSATLKAAARATP